MASVSFPLRATFPVTSRPSRRLIFNRVSTGRSTPPQKSQFPNVLPFPDVSSRVILPSPNRPRQPDASPPLRITTGDHSSLFHVCVSLIWNHFPGTRLFLLPVLRVTVRGRAMRMPKCITAG